MKTETLTMLLSALLITAASVVTVPPIALVAGRTQQTAAVDTDRIVAAFTAKETEFRKALAQYTFKRDALIQTFGQAGQISGEYHRTSRLSFDENGKPVEKILFFPTSTLLGLSISNEGLDEPGGVPLFALEAAKVTLYNFKYVGKERIDELDLHVFEVSPKSMPDAKKERLFQGRVWVDTQGNQIVKTRGKGVPEPKNSSSPTMEIFREDIDGFWFPTYVYADEEFILPSGYPLKARFRIQFSEFKKMRK